MILLILFSIPLLVHGDLTKLAAEACGTKPNGAVGLFGRYSFVDNGQLRGTVCSSSNRLESTVLSAFIHCTSSIFGNVPGGVVIFNENPCSLPDIPKYSGCDGSKSSVILTGKSLLTIDQSALGREANTDCFSIECNANDSANMYYKSSQNCKKCPVNNEPTEKPTKKPKQKPTPKKPTSKKPTSKKPTSKKPSSKKPKSKKPTKKPGSKSETPSEKDIKKCKKLQGKKTIQNCLKCLKKNKSFKQCV